MRLCALLVCVLVSCPLFAQTPVFRISKQPDWTAPVSIAAYTSFYEVPGEVDLPISEIKKQHFRVFASKGNERKKGNKRPHDITWLRFTLSNAGQDTIRLLYECNVHHLVTVFQNDRQISSRGFKFANEEPAPLILYPGETNTYWVKVENVILAVLPIISELHTTTSRFAVQGQQFHALFPLIIMMSIWCGCFIFMSVYAAYRFYLNRDRLFLYYSIFSLQLFWTCSFAMSSRIGLDIIPHSFSFLLFVSYCFFIARAIDMKHSRPSSWRILKVLMVLLVVLEINALVERYVTHGPVFTFIAFYNYQLIVDVIVIAFCLVQVMTSNSPIRKFLTTGIVFIILIGFVPVIVNPWFSLEKADAWEAIVNYPFTFAFAGFAVENFCFAMALAYRSRLVEIEKETLQKSYAQRLENDLADRTAEIRNKSKELEESTVQQITTSYERRLAQMETIALRAQMNPHFIFNCLNSIKLYTLENDSVSAADYLTRFSRLIRLVLENSKTEKISLAVEVETHQLYVDMEAMRFKNRFSFVINMHGNVDPEYLDIPPLLIQPYVENAIWHGLMQKEEPGQVELFLELVDEHSLRVEITDDGIGRTKASEYKTKSATRHKSFGMKVNSERIALINQQATDDTTVVIEDLVGSDGRAAGTKVTLVIPV